MRRTVSLIVATVLTMVASPIMAQEPAPNLCLQVDAPAELDTVEAWQVPQLIARGEIAVLAVVDCEPRDAAPSELTLTGDFVGLWWITDIVSGVSGSDTLAMAATEAQTGLPGPASRTTSWSAVAMARSTPS